MNTVVINLAAGPGAGKSTTAAGLFYLMKTNGYKVELVTEFAKDLTYEEAFKNLSNQLYVLGEQHHRLARLKGQVDYVITDSPLFLGCVYGDEKWHPTIWTAYNDFTNVLFKINRVKPYAPYGRSQTEQEARELDVKITCLMAEKHLPFTSVIGDVDAPHRIYNILKADKII